jgi:hypothetical protein
MEGKEERWRKRQEGKERGRGWRKQIDNGEDRDVKDSKDREKGEDHQGQNRLGTNAHFVHRQLRPS